MFKQIFNKIINTDTITLIILFGLTSVIPLFYLGFPFWVNFLLFFLLEIPFIGQILGLILWIWGLCSNLSYPQDIFSYLYYIAFAIVFVPVISAVMVKFVNRLINKIKQS